MMEFDGIPGSENTVPSSPSRNAVFSDPPQCASTPPSSPPYFPWERQHEPDIAPRAPSIATNNAFSVLGKRKALESVSENTQIAKKQRILAPPKSKSLTQMQISLGQEVQKRCKTCGMEYVASSTEDRKLHDKYHKQNTQGYDVGNDFVQKSRPGSTYPGAVKEDWICAVDSWDKPARKRRGQAVLEIVQRELGAVEIPESDVWDKALLGQESASRSRYTAYMYVRGTKCIAFLLVQSINEAFRVEEPAIPIEEHTTSDETITDRKTESAATSSLAALRARKQAAADRQSQVQQQPLTLTNKTHPDTLGISRIWTSPLHRKHSFAMTLLDTALTHLNGVARRDQEFSEAARMRSLDHQDAFDEQKKVIDGIIVRVTERVTGKEDVAFSQPTEAGRRLAERWFGMKWGWGVYVD